MIFLGYLTNKAHHRNMHVMYRVLLLNKCIVLKHELFYSIDTELQTNLVEGIPCN